MQQRKKVKRKNKLVYMVLTENGKLMQLSRFCNKMGLNYGSIVIRINRMPQEEKLKLTEENVVIFPIDHDVLSPIDRRCLREK